MQKTELKFVRIWDHGVEHPLCASSADTSLLTREGYRLVDARLNLS
jgi:hypothetical protein